MNYTKQAEKVLETAKKAAKELRHHYIGTEHLLLGLRKVFEGVAGQILDANAVTEEEIYKIIKQLVSLEDPHKVEKPQSISPRLEEIIEDSRKIALNFHSKHIGTEHMLFAIINDYDCVAAKILTTLNVNLQKVYQDILEAIGIDPKLVETFGGEEKRVSGIVEQYASDLTELAAEGKLDPVIGREKEIGRLMQILSRRTKNNPCLIGEPGVGKTAVIEGMAAAIASGMVPDAMRNKRILTLDLAGMIAGSKYRGEFEERMKKLIADVKQSQNIILFLDEVHTIIGAGGAEGAIDASNILKPSLARGEIQLIGATTITEYRKYIEKDAALERRFQPITIEEPTKEGCLQILTELKGRYEEHHNVQVEEAAIHAAVQLSSRYINDRNLPDKAIDVLDEACSKASLKGFERPKGMEEIEKELKEIVLREEAVILEGNIKLALQMHKEQEVLQKKLDSMKKRFLKKNAEKVVSVTEKDIAEVVCAWTKVPVDKLQESESRRLQRLEEILHKRVIGQAEAVTAVARAVKRGRVGLKNPKRPIGSFLFLGPTGVGKTELSKALAEILFGEEEAIIRVDMSEYMEKHSVARMIGSPPGYVGHEEGGQLSEKVRRNPYSVILFDEIEKAHPDVFNILLQVLDDGRITDSHGRKVDFSNTVIIMTSNAGAKSIIEPKKLGFGTKEDEKEDYTKMKSNVMKEVRMIFRPEFLNRIDEVIVFHPLTKEEMKKIVNLICKELVVRVKEQLKIELSIKDTVKKLIVEKGYDPKYGARPLRRAVQKELEDVLAEAILCNQVKEGSKVIAKTTKGKVEFEV